MDFTYLFIYFCLLGSPLVWDVSLCSSPLGWWNLKDAIKISMNGNKNGGIDKHSNGARF
jgi:hypothetical protein